MAAESDSASPEARGKGGKGLPLGLIGGAALGGTAFALVYLGIVDPERILPGAAGNGAAGPADLDAIGFIQLDPIVISLPRGGAVRQLKFLGHLEVVPAHADEVIALMPRIQDALNTYLRAVEIGDLEQPGATIWLRAQMLRRVQVVTGEGRVRDLLISEFVLG
jgi:flagellar FliL protein